MTVKMNNIYGGQDKSVELLTDQILETRVKLLDLGTTPLVLTSMGRKIEERPTHMCGLRKLEIHFDVDKRALDNVKIFDLELRSWLNGKSDVFGFLLWSTSYKTGKVETVQRNGKEVQEAVRTYTIHELKTDDVKLESMKEFISKKLYDDTVRYLRFKSIGVIEKGLYANKDGSPCCTPVVLASGYDGAVFPLDPCIAFPNEWLPIRRYADQITSQKKAIYVDANVMNGGIKERQEHAYVRYLNTGGKPTWHLKQGYGRVTGVNCDVDSDWKNAASRVRYLHKTEEEVPLKVGFYVYLADKLFSFRRPDDALDNTRRAVGRSEERDSSESREVRFLSDAIKQEKSGVQVIPDPVEDVRTVFKRELRRYLRRLIDLEIIRNDEVEPVVTLLANENIPSTTQAQMYEVLRHASKETYLQRLGMLTTFRNLTDAAGGENRLLSEVFETMLHSEDTHTKTFRCAEDHSFTTQNGWQLTKQLFGDIFCLHCEEEIHYFYEPNFLVYRCSDCKLFMHERCYKYKTSQFQALIETLKRNVIVGWRKAIVGNWSSPGFETLKRVRDDSNARAAHVWVSNLQDKNEKRVKSTVFPESEDDMKLVKSAASKDLNRKLVQKLTGVCERLSMVHQLEEWFFFTKLKRNVQESEDAMETLRGKRSKRVEMGRKETSTTSMQDEIPREQDTLRQSKSALSPGANTGNPGAHAGGKSQGPPRRGAESNTKQPRARHSGSHHRSPHQPATSPQSMNSMQNEAPTYYSNQAGVGGSALIGNGSGSVSEHAPKRPKYNPRPNYEDQYGGGASSSGSGMHDEDPDGRYGSNSRRGHY